MNSNLRNRLLIAAVLATTAPLALTSTSAFARQGYGHQHEKADKTDKEKQAEREKAQAAREKAAGARQEARQAQGRQEQARQAQMPPRPRMDVREQQSRAIARQTAAEQNAQRQEAAAKLKARSDRQQAQVANQAARTEARSDRQQAQVANQAARTEARVDRQQAQAGRRLAKAEQDRLIAQQKARVNSYRTWTTAQQVEAKRVAAAVQAQNRSAQYAYIQDYNNRLYSQQQQYSNQSFDYYNDPYFYSAPIYSYMRNGTSYSTNQYGANMLQTAVNDGYNEGYHAGRADRMDGWRADYRSSYVYQNASYGYNGYYGDRNEYSYYFRQGFQRGYEDGYYSRTQYGQYQNGNYSLIGTVLNSILGLQPYGNRY